MKHRYKIAAVMAGMSILMGTGSVATSAAQATGSETAWNICRKESIVIPVWKLNDCGGVLFPNITIPDWCLPEQPDESLPEQPDESLPEQPDESLPEQPDESLPGENEGQNSYVQQVVALVNEERGKEGLAPLKFDEKMGQAALVRAKETEQVFSHTRPDGRNFSTALTEAGVSYLSAGENIAYGQKTPEQVVEGWMNSPGHRANIMNTGFTRIGVGYYQSAAGVNYWTQLFAN